MTSGEQHHNHQTADDFDSNHPVNDNNSIKKNTPREALIQMLKAMRAQDKKEAQAAQAQDRVSIQDFFWEKEMLSKMNCNKKTT